MDQAPRDGGLGAQASFDSLNGDDDDDAFSEVTGISRRSVSGWGSFAGLQGAERNVSRFFRRFIPSHTTAQTGMTCNYLCLLSALQASLQPSAAGLLLSICSQCLTSCGFTIVLIGAQVRRLKWWARPALEIQSCLLFFSARWPIAPYHAQNNVLLASIAPPAMYQVLLSADCKLWLHCRL